MNLIKNKDLNDMGDKLYTTYICDTCKNKFNLQNVEEIGQHDKSNKCDVNGCNNIATYCYDFDLTNNSDLYKHIKNRFKEMLNELNYYDERIENYYDDIKKLLDKLNKFMKKEIVH